MKIISGKHFMSDSKISVYNIMSGMIQLLLPNENHVMGKQNQ